MTCSRAHVHYLHAKCHEKLVRDFHKSLGRHARVGRPQCCMATACAAKTDTRELVPEDFLNATEIDTVMSCAHRLAMETPLVLAACVKIARAAAGDWKDSLARARATPEVRGVVVLAGALPSDGGSDDDDDDRPDRCVGMRRDGTRCVKSAQRGELCARCHEAQAALKRLAGGKENATPAAPKKRAAAAARAPTGSLRDSLSACKKAAPPPEAAGEGALAAAGETVVEIPAGAVGLLIGKKGATIAEIKKQSGATLEVERLATPEASTRRRRSP